MTDSEALIAGWVLLIGFFAAVVGLIRRGRRRRTEHEQCAPGQTR